MIPGEALNLKSVLDVKIVKTKLASTSSDGKNGQGGTSLVQMNQGLGQEMTTVYVATHSALYQFQGTG